jgi:hypothetical protein
MWVAEGITNLTQMPQKKRNEINARAPRQNHPK